MGKFRNRYLSIVSKAVASRKTGKKQLVLSIISLILAAVVLITGTFCWFALSKSTGNAENVNLSVGNGLRVNDLGDSIQKFKDDSFLLPASSVDGRNLFFPTDGTDFSNETSNMTFRSANAGDRNYDYVQLDFNLTAEANNTTIYLDKDTSLKIDVPDDLSGAALENYQAAAAKAEKALRTAIYYDGMEAPVVFTSQMNPCYVEAVKDIDRSTGRFLESSGQVAVPFKDYSYGKHELAVLNQGETRPFSLIIWLEGTDTTNCVSNFVMLKQLVLNLKFTTCWDNTVDIIFDTGAQNNATATALSDHPEYSLVLNYTYTYTNSAKIQVTENMKFTMQKVDPSDNTKWRCSIPGIAHNDIKFQIINDSNNTPVYEWKQTSSGASTLNRGTATTYFVDTINGLSSCGHWYDGEIATHGEGHDSGIIDDDDW